LNFLFCIFWGGGRFASPRAACACPRPPPGLLQHARDGTAR
jgi:hypothetical protein